VARIVGILVFGHVRQIFLNEVSLFSLKISERLNQKGLSKTAAGAFLEKGAKCPTKIVEFFLSQ
jgi:hypothetical protein